MKTIVLKVEYDGSDYYGFQKQTGNEDTTPSVQGRIEAALDKILGRHFDTKGSGRTDSGVHALGQIVSVNLGEDFELKIPPAGLKKLLNNKLGPAIVVRNVDIVDGDFHARGCAKVKSYVYVVKYGPPDAFTPRYAWQMNKKIDFGRLKELISLIKGEVFCAPFCDGEIDTLNLESYYKNIFFFRFYKLRRRSMIVFIIKARGFLYKMVRRLIGFLMDYSTGRFDMDTAKKIMSDYKMRSIYVTAPPSGLYLYKVKY
ncbi:MAG TPA: tRNA pseudouridine synthase A [Candidatus Wallbacteria bacterium]|nr:MAG: tRNA pseudouridine synthase A [bacterium ADurb.Bin243]HPG56884.1 tRNA pseudouridine synthase A [Candidatus Wallbacteria bacterium]